jgi:hypothetical protein
VRLAADRLQLLGEGGKRAHSILALGVQARQLATHLTQLVIAACDLLRETIRDPLEIADPRPAAHQLERLRLDRRRVLGEPRLGGDKLPLQGLGRRIAGGDRLLYLTRPIAEQRPIEPRRDGENLGAPADGNSERFRLPAQEAARRAATRGAGQAL